MDVVQEIDRLCESFQADWRRGRSPDLTAWLPRVEAEHRESLCRRLVVLDIKCRLENFLSVDPSAYAVFGPDILALAQATLANPGSSHPIDSMSASTASKDSLADTHLITVHDGITADPFVGQSGHFNSDVPSIFGRHQVQSLLGEGGFGRVWLAFDPELQRDVAIKVPRLDSSIHHNQLHAFLEEARRSAQLDHPHIVPVLDVGRTAEGLPFVVSRYIDGVSLKDRLKQDPVSLQETVRTITAIGEALHHAHLNGIIHRDVKPANILIDKVGTPFLADFGLAVLIQEQQHLRGDIAGSPAYMSPEQVRGLTHQLDGRTDVWSLGVVLYEMLTGTRPFHGANTDRLFEEILTREPRPLRQIVHSISKQVEAVCLQALSRDIAQRFSTAEDFLYQLRACLPPKDDAGSSMVLRRQGPAVERLAYNIPQLPPCYVEREDHLRQIRELLLSQVSQTVGVTGTATLGVQGRGGLGKTVMAAALVHDQRIRKHFHDGTIWLTFGQEPNRPALQRQLLKCLGNSDPACETSAEFRDKLQQSLQDRVLLIVLDDVWETEHVKDFVCASDSVAFLVTTRDGKVLTQLNATEYGLDVLSTQMAMQLLADWSGEAIPHLQHNAEVMTVLAESGKLPLALAVCGAMKRDGHAWADIAEALAESMLDFLDDDAHYNHRSVLKCLAVGVDFLTQTSPEDAARYLELAVFPSDVLIPEATITRYWSRTGQLSGLKVRKLLTTLHRRNLLTLRESGASRFVECHDLQHEYLRMLAVQQNRMRACHEALVDSYQDSEDRLLDDGYYFQHCDT